MSRISGQAFAQSYVELHKVRQVQFGLLNPDEVRRMSVVKIENERIYNDKGQPNWGAINDPRMGTMDKELKCYTCKGSQSECPGHFGHIELARPVFHAGLLEFIRKVLRCVCFNCSRILGDPTKVDEIRKIKAQKTRFGRLLKLCDGVRTCDTELKGCGSSQPKFTKSGLRIKIEHSDENFEAGRDRQQFLYPDEVLRVFERISNEDCELMGFKPAISRPENMIIKNLAVAPPPVRPSVAMSNTMRSEDDLTYAYQKILQCNIQLQTQIQRGANQTTINELRQNLQYYVATLMDNEIQGQPTQKHKSGKPLKAIRARLRGKEGRLRGNLMGKRVDFSARTVITPDPILKLDQLGVPQQIALNLTVPETVTAENIDKMRELVSNGPTQWPGAKYIIRHDERQIDLSQMRNRSDAHLEPGYKVERHLRDDDYVIFNRQPSLHKMSLMGHRVKVLPFSTFRLNLSVTTPYNADFDGDEMNMHVPQSYETMAEIKEIMAVPNQIVSPQSNKPVMGIVQDSLLGTMMFTLKDTFIEKELVMNILMWANYTEDLLPMPAILKPKQLWTGKQLFSLIVPDINYEKYGEKPGVELSNADKNILVRKGELIMGNVTKGTIGNSSGGMVHIIWKEKGPYGCRDFLSNTQLIVNNWLHQNGFTVGVSDIIAKKEILVKIRETLDINSKKVQIITQRAQLGKLKQQPGKNMIESFEASVNSILNTARDTAGNLALQDLNSWNRLKAMVYAGSKGSNLNIAQIMACVGQQNVEGKRIPFGFNKRSLPHFSKDDYGPESKGFVENCYLSGLTPQEFYFHAMGGREGLIDTAVKTAETGYIQRRLIKALEDVMVKYDGTVRTSKEQVIQFLYGEDGMAGEHIEDLSIQLYNWNNDQVEQKCNFMPKDKKGVATREELLKETMETEIVKDIVNNTPLELQLKNEYEQILKDRDDLRYVILKGQDESVHLPVNVPRIIWNAKEQFKIRPNTKSNIHPSYVIEKLTNLLNELSPIPGINVRNDPITLQAKENSTWLFKIYLRYMLSTKSVIQTERMTKDAFDWVLGEIRSRFEQAIVNPGEMVGSIGAQSMGEPATQMTLNTFHSAGNSAKNVTLGVPRLKEIINVAKNIKTPSMKIYLKDKYKRNESKVTQIGGTIEHTTLSHIVKNSAIYYDPDPERTIVKEDRGLVELYNMIPDIDAQQKKQSLSPWLLRFELETDKMQFKDLSMGYIDRKFCESFQDQISVMHTDDNDEKHILRLRLNDIEDDEEETVSMYLKQFQDQLFTQLTLKGINEITKVAFTKYEDTEFDPVTGEKFKSKEKFYMIETDGVALQKVLGYSKVNHQRTISNDIIEILKVLGIEAVRMSLINELRFVLNSYGIYVNYRHLSSLCDIMTQRGILTSITRHGINRVDSGPLRKCSFEETVEILLEAAVFAETDNLTGITENLIMGQLAPFGTGCFDMVIDPSVLQEYSQAKPDEDDGQGGNTDIMNEQNERNMEYYNDIKTPMMGNTPYNQYAGAESTYSAYGTPAYAGSFSPGPNQYSSPGYAQSPNPAMSPSYDQSSAYRTAQSPIYQPYQSPIYHTSDHNNMQSPGASMHNQSPIYSPTGQTNRPSQGYSQFSPAYNSGHNATSPVYQTIGSGNPSYSPSGSGSGSYSPTNYNNTSSPRYSPTTPNYNQYSPQYSPTSNVYGSSPRYQTQASPRYSVDSSQRGQTNQSPSSGYNPNQMYIPNSPVYNPSSPAYNAASNLNPSYTRGGGSPIDDNEDDIKTTNPQKKNE